MTTIEEMKKEKEVLETTILNLVKSFEIKFECNVNKINTINWTNIGDNTPSTTRVNIEVNI